MDRTYFSLYRDYGWISGINKAQRLRKMDKRPPLIKSRIARTILFTLAAAAGGALMTASAAGAVYFMAHGFLIFGLSQLDFKREIKRLEKQGYVALTKTPDGFVTRLKKKAKKRIKQFILQDLRLHSSVNWDGKWRLFIFDVPEKNRIARDLLRKKLKDLGMYNFQRSTFAYPYDCRKEMEFLADYYGMSKYTTYAEVIYSDIDKELRRFFHLPKPPKKQLK